MTPPEPLRVSTTWASRLSSFLRPSSSLARSGSCVAYAPTARNRTYPARMFQDLGIDPSIFDGVTLYRGRGCDRCKNSGYAGRMAIIEAMTISDEIRKLIIARANTREMGKIAIGQGMRTLRMAALDRARDGVSTLEQVLVLTSSN